MPGSDPLDTPDGRCPSPDWIQIEDTGGTRIILAAVPAARPLRRDR